MKTINKELKISAENAFAAYNNTDANGRALLEHLFGKEIFTYDIKDKVKTFKDAVAILGNDNQVVIDYYAIANKTCTENILAFAKLRVITEALNEGWKPKFDGYEYYYYPWFRVYTKKEYEKLNEDKKKEFHVVSRANDIAYAYGGLVYLNAYYSSSNLYTYFG